MIRLKRPQAKVFRSKVRFRVLVAGRRFGKTFLALVELCQAACGEGRLAWYAAPTYRQAKMICWKPLKEMTRPYWASKPNGARSIRRHAAGIQSFLRALSQGRTGTALVPFSIHHR